MCRHLAYLGRPATLAELLIAPPHSLLQQAHAPRCQRHGAMNADGFGVAWWTSSRDEPARHRRAIPMWADRTLASVAGVIESSAVLAAVRNATPGLPIDESNTAPYLAERWAFSHNGVVHGFRDPDGAGEQLRSQLMPRRLAGVEGATDSEVVFALVLGELDAGASPAEALRSATSRVLALAPTSRLNLLLSDGHTIFATACGDTLFTLETDDAIVIASEPFDDRDGWAAVPDQSVVTATPSSLTIGALS
jgi:glutamine amidotransferase